MAEMMMSVEGLYTMEPDLFSGLQVPEGMVKQHVVDAILLECMELEVLYPRPETMKNMIGIWSTKELPTWKRVYAAEHAEYNPIENYNRHQNDTREEAHSGDDVAVGSNQESGTGNLSDTTTHKFVAYNTNQLSDQTQDIQSAQSSNSQTESSRNTLTHGEEVEETFSSHIHGNIGVTTSQQMLESELELAPKINTINYIVNSFKMRFCILVY